jgi:NAD(P)-dependent dehydrogenase (short-subunit alcohol dehydrogenase family)
MLFAGKTAVVTGAASGLGLATVRTLLKHGAKSVVGVDMNTYYDIKEPGFKKIGMNVANRAEVDNLYENVLKHTFDNRAPDLLVNCAGITRDVLLLKMTDKEWDDVMNVNLKSLYLMSQNYAKWVKDEKVENGEVSGSRSIVNISSISGKTGNVGQTNYSASKAGVIGFTKSAAKELTSLDIRVNCILPGFIETPMTQAIPDKVKRKVTRGIPMGEMGSPNDIADGVLYLGSDLSKYVTGIAHEVTGGLAM